MTLASRATAVLFAFAVTAVTAATSTPALAAESERVFTAKSEAGEAWVNIDLTRRRLGDSHVPLLVAVHNLGSTPAVFDRSSIRLTARGMEPLAMSSIEGVRKDYGAKMRFDLAVLRAGGQTGVPIGSRLQEDRFVPSEFFPDSAVKNDHITLATQYWMIDLFYFAIPDNVAERRSFTVEIHPKGWELPLRIPIKVPGA